VDVGRRARGCAVLVAVGRTLMLLGRGLLGRAAGRRWRLRGANQRGDARQVVLGAVRGVVVVVRARLRRLLEV
jgi:hypothetical protein